MVPPARGRPSRNSARPGADYMRGVAPDDRPEVDAARQGAEGAPQSPSSRDAQNASATAGCRSAPAARPAARSRAARRSAARGLDPSKSDSSPACLPRRATARSTAAPCSISSIRTPVECGVSRHRAQHVEADHVAEPSQIELSGASRYSRGSPTPRRSRSRRSTRAPRRRAPAARLQIQYLLTAVARRRNSVLALVAGAVVGARQAHRGHRGGFGLHAEVREHVLHQRAARSSSLPNAER